MKISLILRRGNKKKPTPTIRNGLIKNDYEKQFLLSSQGDLGDASYISYNPPLRGFFKRMV